MPADDASNERGPVITKLSPHSVADTVDRLIALLNARDIKVFTVIDHSGEARAAGLAMRDTKLVIFGNPASGTPIMEIAPLAALDLPLKVLVWADDTQTKVSYAPPSALAARYGLTDELATRLAGIHAITDALITQ